MSESTQIKNNNDDALEAVPFDIDPRIIEAVRAEAESVSYAIAHQEIHSGPMPSPRQLSEYDNVLPGLAAEIRNEFLANGKHVREMERLALEAHKNDNMQNRKVAERLVWGALAASVLLALLGHDWVAGTIAVSTVGAVITGFLKQKIAASKENNVNNHVD